MEPAPVRNLEDIALAGRAARGDLPAWHEFVTRYSGLIRAIVRRYNPVKPEDDQLNLYVEVLEYMYAEGLRRYDGRAALSTWVMTVTRSRVLDAIRRDSGRRRAPAWVLKEPPLDRRVFQLCFVELRGVSVALSQLRREGHVIDEPGLDQILERLETRLDRHYQKRLAYDLQARSIGALSGRLLETLDHLRMEQETAVDAERPDVVLYQQRMRQLLEQIGECVRRLDDAERQVIELRFYQEMSAPGIARQMDLAGPRRAYALINRALASLRVRLDGRPRRAYRPGVNAPAKELPRR